MGEVYRARDTRLDRTVAIKVLPSHVSGDPALRERFEREARTVAALNHPHICTLHDVGHQDGTDFLVMEHLDGETLAARLAKGALPIDQALAIAIQIADALDKAHRAGIVHRDLKPGNIMLTKSGAKLLDFGLAKITPAVVGASGLSMAPTGLTPVTMQGTILGTLQYMAPEQIEGQEADARTDIFAFGSVLYEMLTGKKAFEGKTQASLIAAIIGTVPPPVSTRQPVVPREVDRVVKRCLAKDPDDRWQTTADLLAELQWIVESPGQDVAGLPTAHRARERVVWIALMALLLAATIALGVRDLRRPLPESAEMRLEITTPPTIDPVSFAISPDGRLVVFVATVNGSTQLYTRSLASTSAQPLANTDGAKYPFWSPDSRSIGFFADSKLKRIDIDGGPVQILADARVPAGGTWNHEGAILFAPTTIGSIYRVSATGGTPVAVTHPQSPQQQGHVFPSFLPDGGHFLYFVTGVPANRGVYLASLQSGETTRLFDADTPAIYAQPGYLLFARQGALVAQPFDMNRLAVAGESGPVAGQVALDAYTAAVSVTTTGMLAYRTGSGLGVTQFVWVDRTGHRLGAAGNSDASNLSSPELAPHDTYIAMDRTVNGNTDVWVTDLAHGVSTRFTFDPASDGTPIWSPDGQHVIFRSLRKGVFDLYQKFASGAGTEELLLASHDTKTPMDVTPDGRLLLYRSVDANNPLSKTGWDLLALPLTGERKPFAVVNTEAEEADGQFSPDGRWLAYASNASGRFEVYVQPFPGPGGKWQVSANGGVQARWRRDGKELFYLALDGMLMSVPLTSTPDGQALTPGTPVALFPARLANGTTPSGGRQQYAVASDGKRFLLNMESTDSAAAPITVVLNWARASRR